MGWGDQLMALGRAQRLAEGSGKRVRILGLRGRRLWSPLWEGDPRIVRPEEKTVCLEIYDGGHCRPYIAVQTPQRFTWRRYVPWPARLQFTEGERALAARTAGAIVIEPNPKPRDGDNKDWTFKRWCELVRARPGLDWVQLGSAGARRVPGARIVETRDFREACATIAGARAAVLPEGGLHHAAAAAGVPAVVIFGGFISPDVTGYKAQRSLYESSEAHPLGCGIRSACAHCRSALEAITVGRVLEELEGIL